MKKISKIPDISVNVTAHHEGRLAHRTMRSLFRAVEFANANDISTEIIVVLDRPDEKTKEYFSGYSDKNISQSIVDFGDLGLSRNYGINKAAGKYVAILDADNLFGEEWLYKAFQYLEEIKKNVIVHPEYHIVFEGKMLIWHQISSTDRAFRVEDLLQHNYWDAVCMASRDVFIRHPYVSTTQSAGFGFEDWHFNCQTLANGIEHVTVPETVHFLRIKKTGSLLAESTQAARIMRPARLFEPSVFSALFNARKPEEPAKESLKRLTFKETITSYCSRIVYYIALNYYKQLIGFLNPVFRKFPKFKDLLTSLVIAHPTDTLKGLPDWLIGEWRDMHMIEPQLFPEMSLVNSIPVYSVPMSRLGRPYIELCGLYGTEVSHVFMVPFLKPGGADRVTINYVTALTDNHLARNIVVISTMETASPWAQKLPKGTRFIEFGKLCSNLSEDERLVLLTKLLLQMKPKVVHNINSELAYKMFVTYGKALMSLSNLYASSFCKDMTEEGKTVGWPYMYLPDCVDYLKAVFCDNSAFPESLRETYAFDRKKFLVHYQPAELSGKRPKRSVDGIKQEMNVLWASRIDRQKRPDILFQIAERCRELPFKFHVYGTSVLTHDIYSAKLKALKNVIVYGPFDGFNSLPTNKFDLFLYTSQWDGLPTILFDAISAGLPVVASKVGGVPELIVNKETGFLVEPYDNIDEYVASLKGIFSDQSRLPKIVDNAFELLSQRHSWKKFVAALTELPDYVEGVSKE